MNMKPVVLPFLVFQFPFTAFHTSFKEREGVDVVNSKVFFWFLREALMPSHWIFVFGVLVVFWEEARRQKGGDYISNVKLAAVYIYILGGHGVLSEDVEILSKNDNTSLLESVVNSVNASLAEVPTFGLEGPTEALETQEVLEAISRCNSNGGPKGKFWVLDPVDGTLGFVRGDQYAVALALIEDGEVILGVLGCPNYPMKKAWLNYHQRYYRLMSNLSSPTYGSWHKGCCSWSYV